MRGCYEVLLPGRQESTAQLCSCALRVLFQFAMLLKESFITSLKLLVVVKGTYMEELRHHDW